MGHKIDWFLQIMKNQNSPAFHAVSDQTKKKENRIKNKEKYGLKRERALIT